MGSALCFFRFVNIQHLDIIINISNSIIGWIYIIINLRGNGNIHYNDNADEEFIISKQDYDGTLTVILDGLNAANGPPTANPTSYQSSTS